MDVRVVVFRKQGSIFEVEVENGMKFYVKLYKKIVKETIVVKIFDCLFTLQPTNDVIVTYCNGLQVTYQAI